MLDRRNQIVGYARECVGTPFMHQGRECGVGLDCVGVLCHVASKIGYSYHDVHGYPKVPRRNTLLDAFKSQLIQIHENESLPGDVVAIQCMHRLMTIHCGILTPHGLVHALYDVGKVVETVIDKNPNFKIVEWYKFK